MKIKQKGNDNNLIVGNENTMISGNGNSVVNINGNNNIFNIGLNLKQSLLYDLCKELYYKIDFKEVERIEYKLQNSDWEEKLKYNKIEEYYKERFTEISYSFDNIEEVLNSLENQDAFIKWLNLKYRKLCTKYKNKPKEEILIILNEKLEELLINMKKNDNISIEELSMHIDAIIFYAFTKCKVLEPIKK